jgi:GT2 family glycosyltransferase
MLWPFPLSVPLTLRRRWPAVLPESMVEAVRAAPLLRPPPPAHEEGPGVPAERVSIVIPILDNFVCNRLCLESLLANTSGIALEVLAVDNCSTDGTRDYLEQLSGAFPNVHLLFADRNLGFAAAVNWGLSSSRGDYLVVLNNDVVLPPGWLAPLLRPLADPEVGMVGPVTNRTGNEAQIETTYATYEEMVRFAAERAASHAGLHFQVRMLTMFCVALRRDVYEQIGPLDECFEVGLFEDDDYSMRVRSAGFALLCVEDAFVHHFGEMSLGQLPQGTYGPLFHKNRCRWEAKWSMAWQPHPRRHSPSYEALRVRIRQSVDSLLPAAATVLVVSKGDDDLLHFSGCTGRHFPQDGTGAYAGHHPANGAEAVSHLEQLRDGGAQFLLFPKTEYWWLDHYSELASHLQERYPVVDGLDDSCRIYALAGV